MTKLQLPTIAKRINAAHKEIEHRFDGLLDKAYEVGELLIKAKAELGPGQKWLPWLAENCPEVSERKCQTYMQLYHHKAELKKRGLCGSIHEALEAIATPRWKPASPSASATASLAGREDDREISSNSSLWLLRNLSRRFRQARE